MDNGRMKLRYVTDASPHTARQFSNSDSLILMQGSTTARSRDAIDLKHHLAAPTSRKMIDRESRWTRLNMPNPKMLLHVRLSSVHLKESGADTFTSKIFTT